MQRLRISLVFALLCSLAAFAGAQLQSGNLYGTTKDDKGAVLPGVTVTLSGQGAPQVQVSGADGAVRFLGLSPGSYSVKAELQGFSTVEYPNVVINVGRNTSIELALSGAVEDVITVTAESPLLDEKRIGQTSTVSQTELARIPTARDPWAVLQSTPGVLSDRINVGGNESGQQSNFIGPGVGGDQAIWALDGVVITDMSATGSSPNYYDFDAFEEMQVTTGGSDVTVASPGVVLNMVTKRGTNEWRGSGRYFTTNDSLQSDLAFSKGELGKPGPWNNNRTQASFKQGNRIKSINDWGLELGGPIVKDRLWIWGSYAKPVIDLRTINDFKDKSTLENWDAKLNWQVTQANAFTGFILDSGKTKIGRNAGPARPQPTTWDQGDFGPKPATYKLEDTHIFSSNFYLTGMYSKVNGGFALVPEGGDVAPFQDSTATWHNSFFLIEIERPQDQMKLDSSTFFNTGTVSHELKFGAGHRTADQSTLSRTQGGYYSQDLSLFGGQQGAYVVNVARDSDFTVKAKYDSAYVQDTLSIGSLTANVGLRYDKQGGSNAARNVAANRFRPDILPAVRYPGGPAGFEWKTIAPRLGLTYALGTDRKTLLRASFSQFADQLGTGFISQLNPLGVQSYAYFYYVYTPTAANSLPAGCCTGPAEGFSANVNPNTGQLIQSNQVASGLNAPLTSEALLSVEHALLPEFLVGLNLTYRKTTDILETELLVFDGDARSAANLNQTGRVNQRSDYVQRDMNASLPGVQNLTGIDPHGNAYSVPIYQLRSGVTTRGGTRLENGDREQEYKGASLVLTKRLSNRWMLRGNFTYSDWSWKTPESARANPTLGLRDDGAPVVVNAGVGSGSKGNVWINSKWSYSLNALYQIAPDRPWGFNVAGNVTGRQGYPIVYLRNVGNLFSQGNIQQQVTKDADAYRLSNVNQLDLRVEKDFEMGDFGFTLGVDCFNVLNSSTVLQRAGRLNANNSNFVTEIVSPRLFRVGAKFSFR